ncbi:MAG TPA: methyltransferase [Vicinamibacterales bacterium]|nr:methyltransferase [Vicinamibacterales bacterium]
MLSKTQPSVHVAEVDPDLPLLAGSAGAALARSIDAVLREVHFDQVNHDLRLPCYGGDYTIRPFPLPASPVDTHEMKRRLREAVKASRHSSEAALARRIQQGFAFFMFGDALTPEALAQLFGPQRGACVDQGFALGLFIRGPGQTVRMNGLSLFSKQLRGGAVVRAFADTPPHFATRLAELRVYVGADSYELMERVSARGAITGTCVEMGSGSGVQLIAALKQCPGLVRAIGVERDRRARHVSRFNAALNAVDDRMVIVDTDDELSQRLDGQQISFAMTNPPFLAMPEWIEIDADDRAFFSGLTGVRTRDRAIEADLRTLMPAAGWGGDDGCAVTRQFIDALAPHLAADGEVIVYSQFAGDADGPTALAQYVRERGGFRLTFEPAASRVLSPAASAAGAVASPGRPRLSAVEAAASAARLIVAALLARDQPRRLRISVRADGPEHAVMLRCARRLEDSYRRQQITHFHDGVAVLARRGESAKEH